MMILAKYGMWCWSFLLPLLSKAPVVGFHTGKVAFQELCMLLILGLISCCRCLCLVLHVYWLQAWSVIFSMLWKCSVHQEKMQLFCIFQQHGPVNNCFPFYETDVWLHAALHWFFLSSCLSLIFQNVVASNNTKLWFLIPFWKMWVFSIFFSLWI